MRATCWGIGPTRSRDRRRRVLFDCSPDERSDIRGLRICYGSRISLRSCGLLAGVWGRRDRETEGGGRYLIVARMSAATSGSSHLLWFPHIAALMRATCWGMGPTRSRDRRRRVLFDCSPHEHSDIRGLRICYGSRISLRSCGLLAGVWGRRDRETEGGGCYLIVARMSTATSGVFAFAMVPAYRCAHAGYLLGYGADGIERPKAAGVI